MELKGYQRRTLDRLADFFRLAQMDSGIAAAYRAVAHRKRNESGREVPENPYASGKYESRISGLADCPHVCLRVPTGGGKTLLAAHAAPLAVSHWEWLAEREGAKAWWRPPVLWLVPSSRIREQTADALRNARHPCRTAMSEGFEGGVSVYDIGDCCDIPAAAYAEKSCVVVSTIQAIHVEETHEAGSDEKARRRVYAHHENLEPHFKQTPEALIESAELESAPKSLGGGPAFSFANWMRLTRPIVILDEAHNATTDKWNMTFPRFRPSCILEFTATPRPESGKGTARGFKHNVLASATAEELESEEMIKLPVRLTEHPNGWESAVSAAVAEVRRLGKIAAEHDPDVRPLGLYQATPKNGNAPVDAVKECIAGAGVPDEEIAVATGDVRELENVDLLDEKCPVRHVVTVQALREGWDCPFAYVLCSAANLTGATAVEQILGRVLRMPFAEKRNHPAMNCAYAHVPENNFASAAEQLREKMVAMGFEEDKARAAVSPSLPDIDSGGDSFFGGFAVRAEAAPDFGDLDAETRKAAEAAVEVKRRKDGGADVILKASVPGAARDAIVKVIAQGEQERGRFELNRACVRLAMKKSPARRGEKFPPLPQLQFYFGEENCYLNADPDEFYYAADWNNFPEDCVLDPAKFRVRKEGNNYTLSLEDGEVKLSFAGQSAPLEIPEKERAESEERLIGRLERDIRDKRYDPDALRGLIRRNLAALKDGGGFTTALLSRCRRQLAEALKVLLRRHEERCLRESWEFGLFGVENPPRLSEFKFAPPKAAAYSCDPERAYRGRYKFGKHYYGAIADLKESGEEYECAKALDENASVKYWIRNPDRKPDSFRLPLAESWFHPDFVAVLENGRVLAVEYKGGHLMSDAKPKKRVGELWEKVCGDAFFIMPTKKKTAPPVAEQLREKIAEIMKAA